MAVSQFISNLLSSTQVRGMQNAAGGIYGEALYSKAAKDNYYQAKAQRKFSLAATAINPSAFVGGAAGTPVFGIYNPIGNLYDLVINQVKVAFRTTGSAAVATDFNFWIVGQGATSPSGTQTAARNAYTASLAGSSAYCMVNTANTAALATTLALPSISMGLTATTAIIQTGVLTDVIDGNLIVAPGVYLAWGLSVALTAGSIDAAIVWDEMPI